MRPRIRTIKPEAFTDEDLWDLEQETGLPIFRAFAGLWCHADREGRFEWRARPLKAGILPYWDGDFSRVLDALATRGLVRKYVCDGREFGVIPTFSRHQFINGKEPQSELPEPAELIDIMVDPHVDNASTTREAREAHVPSLPFPSHSSSLPVPDPKSEPTSKASKQPKAPRRKPKISIPDDWSPKPRHAAKASERNVDCALAAEKFRGHAESVDRKCSDWDRAFDNWLLNERPGPKLAFDAFAYARQEREREAAGGVTAESPQNDAGDPVPAEQSTFVRVK